MAKLLEVNTGTLRNDVNEIQGELRGIRTEMSNLRGAASSLGNTWEGDAKTAFMEALQDDMNRLESLVNAIGKFTDKTEESRIAYEKCENSVSQAVSSMKV